MQRVVLAVLLAHAAPALAHDTWLAARRAEVAPGDEVRLDLTSGMRFPALEYAVRADRLAAAGFRAGGEAAVLAAPTPGPKALTLTARPAREGLAVGWIALAPRELSLEPRLVAEYLEEIGETERAGRLWAARPEPKRWRETYRKHAKALLRVGTPADGDPTWREPVGLALEIVPEPSVESLAKGGRVEVRVLKAGQPFADFPVAAIAASGARTLARTDAAGHVCFANAEEGPLLLAGTDLRLRDDGRWESDFSTLTLTVPVPASVPPTL